ncbi:MAG: phosphate transport system regulatory protein PhoU [Gammaproteobacteria bacterium]|nr:MAG: phosphate transport system regulatory protein PhoU [Gammaproteobacteria bacterium]
MDNKLHLTQHISKKFNQELEDVRNQVLKMGGLVEQQVSDGLTALLEANSELGKQVVERDTDVNKMELDIDEKCTEILARRQPAASDLRLMVSIIKTITDLERIGDEAEKLGRNAQNLSHKAGANHHFLELRNLGEIVKKMLNRSLNAYARMDVDEAISIIKSDVLVNQEFDTVSRLLIMKMMEDPREIKNTLYVSWCARALERIGDHSQNICEYIVYLVKGKDVRHLSLDDIKKQIQ